MIEVNKPQEKNKLVEVLLEELVSLEEELVSLEELKERVEMIKTLLNKYGFTTGSNNSVHLDKDSVQDEDISSIEDRGAQIVALFKNRIQKGIKLEEIQKEYNKALTGSRDAKNTSPVNNTVRTLRNKGVLAMVKYNGQNKLSFYGLAGWVDGNNLDQEHQPDLTNLPNIFESIVICGKSEEANHTLTKDKSSKLESNRLIFYHESMSLKEKLLFTLKHTGGGVIGDVRKELAQLDPKLYKDKGKKAFNKAVRDTLYHLRKEGKVLDKEIDGSLFYYLP